MLLLTLRQTYTLNRLSSFQNLRRKGSKFDHCPERPKVLLCHCTLPDSGDRLGANTAARNPTSGFTRPEVVLCEQILVPGLTDEASQAIGRLHGPKYGKNDLPGVAGSQTGSKNMAATRFFDSATPTSYWTRNTLWGLSRTITKLFLGDVTNTPL